MSESKAQKAAAADAARAEANEEPKTVEYDGVTYAITDNIDGDVELLEDVAELGDGDLTMLPRIVKRMIGRPAYEAFKDKHRDATTGIVPTTPLLELWELINVALGE